MTEKKVDNKNKHGHGIEDFLWYVLMGIIPPFAVMMGHKWYQDSAGKPDGNNPLTTTEKSGLVVGILGEFALATAIVLEHI